MSGVTNWFPRRVKPAYVGWYDTTGILPEDCVDGDAFVEMFYFRKYWDGKWWRYGPTGQRCVLQNPYWRGRDSEV